MKAILLCIWVTFLNPIVLSIFLGLAIEQWLALFGVPYYFVWREVNTRVYNSDPELWRRVVGNW